MPVHYSIAPWTRTLNRLDGIHSTNLRRCAYSSTAPSPRRIRRTDSTPLKDCQITRSPCASSRSATPQKDPFSRLPVSLIPEIIQHLDPLDVVVFQRVSKSWKMILASEYIYTLALKQHFPDEKEAKEVWAVHDAGERYPECAVEGYLQAAKRRRIEGVV